MKKEDTLYIIIPHFNFVNYESCTENLYKFLNYSVLYNQIKIVLVEGFYKKEQELPDLSNRVFKHLKIKLKNVLWSKENLINIGFQNLPSDWKYAAWIDRDTFFVNHDWAKETIQKLKKCDLMQPWGECVYLSKNYCVEDTIHDNVVKKMFENIGKRSSCNSFCKTAVLFDLLKEKRTSLESNKNVPRYLKEDSEIDDIPDYVKNLKHIPFNSLGHTGHGWAINRKFYEKIGKIFDVAIIGEADTLIAKGIVQQFDDAIFNLYEVRLPNYRNIILKYLENFKDIKIDYLNNLILHYYHGPTSARFYTERRNIFLDHGFDPDKHLCYNKEGVLEYTKQGKRIESALKQYFFSRREDD